MGKHRKQRESRLSAAMRGAIVAGAVTAGTVALPAAPALAAPLEIPGVGTFDVPEIPGLPPLAPPAPIIAQSAGERALDAARTKVGAAYAYGSSGPNAFDCSGFVQWAYHQAGISLPRTSFEQANVGAPIAFGDLRPGDIVVTNGGGHAGVYAGNGQILHASTYGVPVGYAPLSQYSVYSLRRI